MKKMKKAAALMMTVAMMLSMAACGNSGAKETTGAAEGSDTQVASQAADGEEKTIYIYQMKTEIQDALEKVCEVYSESHPGVKFVCESAFKFQSDSINTAASLSTSISHGVLMALASMSICLISTRFFSLKVSVRNCHAYGVR